MHGFVLMLLILDALLLVLVVLLQAGKGVGLAAEFGGASSSSDAFLGGRQAATLLTKASWTLGGAFMGLALLLAILSARSRAPASILEDQFQAPAQEAPTPLLDREVQGLPEGLVPPAAEEPATEGAEPAGKPPGPGGGN